MHTIETHWWSVFTVGYTKQLPQELIPDPFDLFRPMQVLQDHVPGGVHVVVILEWLGVQIFRIGRVRRHPKTPRKPEIHIPHQRTYRTNNHNKAFAHPGVH